MPATELLGCLVGIIFIATVFYYLFTKVDAGLVGLLISGVAIGLLATHFSRFEHAASVLDRLAEFGVMALLFAVGLDFSLRRLQRLWHFALVGGLAQMGLTSAAGYCVLRALGLSVNGAAFIAVLSAMSSTVICMQLLQKQRKVDGPDGGIAVGVLLFQDLSLLPLMLVLPTLAGPQAGASLGQVVVGTAVLAAIFLVGYFGLSPLFDLIAKQRERHLMRMTLLVVCFGAALATAAGGLSPALGAFVAGLTLSRTRYSYDARGTIDEYISSFGMVFFIAVGRVLDISFVLHNLPLILFFLVVLVLVKFATGMLTVIALRYPLPVAVSVGVLLAQIGELSLVASQLGFKLGVMTEQQCQVFTAVAVLSMVLTPFLTKLGRRATDRMTARAKTPHPAAEAETARLHVIVIGYDVCGHVVHQGCSRLNSPDLARLSFTVIELNPKTAEGLERRGVPCIWGDCSNPEVLDKAGLSKAKLVCIAISDFEALKRAIKIIRTERPDVIIVVRTRFMKDMSYLRKLGADVVVPEDLSTAAVLSDQVLQKLGFPSVSKTDLDQLTSSVIKAVNPGFVK